MELGRNKMVEAAGIEPANCKSKPAFSCSQGPFSGSPKPSGSKIVTKPATHPAGQDLGLAQGVLEFLKALEGLARMEPAVIAKISRAIAAGLEGEAAMDIEKRRLRDAVADVEKTFRQTQEQVDPEKLEDATKGLQVDH
jgi:hypothetical protein